MPEPDEPIAEAWRRESDELDGRRLLEEGMSAALSMAQVYSAGAFLVVWSAGIVHFASYPRMGITWLLVVAGGAATMSVLPWLGWRRLRRACRGDPASVLLGLRCFEVGAGLSLAMVGTLAAGGILWMLVEFRELGLRGGLLLAIYGLFGVQAILSGGLKQLRWCLATRRHLDLMFAASEAEAERRSGMHRPPDVEA